MKNETWRIITRIFLVPVLLSLLLPTTAVSQDRGSPRKVTIDLTARNFSFSEKEITVPAGAAVTIRFSNKDDGIPHNFSVYTDSRAGTVIFKGKILQETGRIEYTFTAPSEPGRYYFRCDIHPAQMNGPFIVTG